MPRHLHLFGQEFFALHTTAPKSSDHRNKCVSNMIVQWSCETPSQSRLHDCHLTDGYCRNGTQKEKDDRMRNQTRRICFSLFQRDVCRREQWTIKASIYIVCRPTGRRTFFFIVCPHRRRAPQHSRCTTDRVSETLCLTTIRYPFYSTVLINGGNTE